MSKYTIEEVPGFYKIIELKPFRKTEGVTFDIVPMEFLPRVDGVDRVIHRSHAVSPGALPGVDRPWYMHPHQEDNLMVLFGKRTVDIYTLEHRRMETFIVEPERITKNGKVIFEGGAMLVWPCNVFHRIATGSEGSASLNFAARYEGFDVRTNFNVYSLDVKNNKYELAREGYLDQTQG